MKLTFKDQAFSFELLRAVGYAPYGGADLGECLATAERIKEGDLESWHTEWLRTAERIQAIAEEALAKQHAISAREAFLRASNYYRTAEFFLHTDPTDPRVAATCRASRACSRRPSSRSRSRSRTRPCPRTSTSRTTRRCRGRPSSFTAASTRSWRSCTSPARRPPFAGATTV